MKEVSGITSEKVSKFQVSTRNGRFQGEAIRGNDLFASVLPALNWHSSRGDLNVKAPSLVSRIKYNYEESGFPRVLTLKRCPRF